MHIVVKDVSEKVDEELLRELFSQVGRVSAVRIPFDRVHRRHPGVAHVQMASEADADYARQVLDGVKLFRKALKLSRGAAAAGGAGPGRRDTAATGVAGGVVQPEVGAVLHVGGVAEEVSVKLLARAFGAFGSLLGPPVVSEDPATGERRGHATVKYTTFAESDAAIAGLDGQPMCGKTLKVEYAMRRDGSGLRHGSEAERAIAAHMPAPRDNTSAKVARKRRRR